MGARRANPRKDVAHQLGSAIRQANASVEDGRRSDMGSSGYTTCLTRSKTSATSASTRGGRTARARSGGYNTLMGIVVHHTASNTSTSNDCDYMWNNATDKPIGAIYLARDGEIVVGAAGATNCAGKGGPYTTSQGHDPTGLGQLEHDQHRGRQQRDRRDRGRQVQQDAYVALVAALCSYYDFDPLRDVLAHFEWTQHARSTQLATSRYANGSASSGTWISSATTSRRR